MRIVWLSANRFGYEVLKSLPKWPEGVWCDVITLDADAKTKMYDGIPPDQWLSLPRSEGESLSVFFIHRMGLEEDGHDLLRMLRPDLVVVAGWRQIIPKEILEIPRLGTVGFHPTMLPQGRGPAPIINTILLGWEHSGVTLYYLDEGTDTGDIIAQEEFDVGPDDYAMDVYNKVITAGKLLAQKYIPLILKEKAPRCPQDESLATVLPKRTLVDNEIKLYKDITGYIHADTEMAYRKIRAFSEPYLGAHVCLMDNVIKKIKKLRIWRATLE